MSTCRSSVAWGFECRKSPTVASYCRASHDQCCAPRSRLEALLYFGSHRDVCALNFANGEQAGNSCDSLWQRGSWEMLGGGRRLQDWSAGTGRTNKSSFYITWWGERERERERVSLRDTVALAKEEKNLCHPGTAFHISSKPRAQVAGGFRTSPTPRGRRARARDRAQGG